jgi:ubiquinone/menaquinone biosynthesis C-methylase UbiE/enamine deaminase RidA (YjgF/YER057c/UK114 family)
MTQPTPSLKHLARQIFGANAAAYASSTNHAQGKSLQRLIELTQPQPHWHVLDVATGAGHTALVFAQHVQAVVASDITPEMLAQAETLAAERGLTNLTTRLADAEQLPFDDAAFDLVTSRIAPHHFPNVQKFVDECARVLKPGGLLAIDDNISPDDPDAARYIDDYERLRDPSHVHCLSLSEWRAAFERAGLTVLHDERVEKQTGFEDWCANQKAPPALVEQLRAVLLSAPEAAKAQLKPVVEDGVLKFSMVEGIVIGQKSSRRAVSTGTSWEAMAGYARAVRVGNHIWVSGTTATNAQGDLVGAGDVAEQTRFAIRKIEAALVQLGANLQHIVRTRVYVRHMGDWETVARVHGEIFGGIRPANTLVQAQLVGDGYLVEVEADAHLEP